MLRRISRLENGSHRSKGQSLVEFAIMIPVLLLIIGGALDLGRLFYAHVAIENAAKEGALYGATNPGCDVAKSGCNDPETVRSHVENESVGIPAVTTTSVCSSGSVESCQPGDTYRVTVTSPFTMVTPILVPLLGGTLQLESSATALVRSAAIEVSGPEPTFTFAPYDPPDCVVPDLSGEKYRDAQQLWANERLTGTVSSSPPMGNNDRIGWQSVAAGTGFYELADCNLDITVSETAPAPDPTPTPTPGPGATPTPTPGPGATANPTPVSTPTAAPSCVVPNFIGTKKNSASGTWSGAGFSGSLTTSSGSGNYTIGTQSVTPSSSRPCSSSITIGP